MAKRAIVFPSQQENDQTSVDPIGAEDLLSARRLGERIRRLRLRQSMGLVDLGKKTGLSASYLSQLETGRVVPTLRNLARISLAFQVDFTHFFDSEEQQFFRVQRKKDRVRIPNGTSITDYIAESFGILIPGSHFRPCMAELLPGPDRVPFHPKRSAGMEMVFVIEGCIEVEHGGVWHQLETKDLLYISSDAERMYRCVGDKSAKAMIISFDCDQREIRSALRRDKLRRQLRTTLVGNVVRS